MSGIQEDNEGERLSIFSLLLMSERVAKRRWPVAHIGRATKPVRNGA